MSRSQNSIVQFLPFVTEKKNFIMLLIFMSLPFVAAGSLFFITQFVCCCFTARQDYFTHFELSKRKVGRKWEIPEKKPPDHLQAELSLSHVIIARLEPTAVNNTELILAMKEMDW